jgi:hypothetical protein
LADAERGHVFPRAHQAGEAIDIVVAYAWADTVGGRAGNDHDSRRGCSGEFHGPGATAIDIHREETRCVDTGKLVE